MSQEKNKLKVPEGISEEAYIEQQYKWWKRTYKPSITQDPDKAYLFHVAYQEGDISKRNLFRVKDRLNSEYRLKVLGGRYKRITTKEGKKMRRWIYPNDITHDISPELADKIIREEGLWT